MVPSIGTLDWVEHQYDWRVVSPSIAILETIAKYEETTPPHVANDLEPPLGREINTDALDNLIAPSTDLSVSFTFADYHIYIKGDTVKIACPEPTPPDSVHER